MPCSAASNVLNENLLCIDLSKRNESFVGQAKLLYAQQQCPKGEQKLVSALSTN